MKKYDYVIIGAGIAGLVASYFLAKDNKHVLLVDSEKETGGLLKSVKCSNYHFDYGTHLLSETGVDELDEFLFSHCTENDYKITRLINNGNYYNNQFNEKNCTVDLTTLSDDIKYKCFFELLECSTNDEVKNLKEFFESRFGKSVYEHVLKDVAIKYFGEEPENLHSSTGYFFDMSGVLAFTKEICESLSSIQKYNDILSHHVRQDGKIKHYPRNGGLSTFIKKLEEKCLQSGVTIKLNSKVTKINCDIGSKKCHSIVSDEEEILFDNLVWTLPAGMFVFLSELDIKTCKPEFRKTTLFDFAFDKKLKTKCCFINVYQPDFISGRITVYRNMGDVNQYGHTCTVEVLSNDDFDESAIDVIRNELMKIGIIDDDFTCLYSGLRKIQNGFPILHHDYVGINNNATDEICDLLHNVILAGKGAGKVFLWVMF